VCDRERERESVCVCVHVCVCVCVLIRSARAVVSCSVAGGSTRGGAGALPLPKFDANGRVVGTNTLGTSKAFLAKGSSRSKVANINAGDITTTADVLESLNPFAAVSRPKLGGVAGDDGQAELAEAIPQSSGVWLTGANAATLGMAALGADAEEEE
jgi:hypothetical protein